jgi:8-oxo-dGTP diphosphatase
MPGGKVNAGENAADAVVREFREETGYDLGSLKVLEVEGDGLVYLGEVGRKLPISPNKDEIAEVGFFKELPAELSFPLVEYERMLEAARMRHNLPKS